MKNLIYFAVVILLFSCDKTRELSSVSPKIWEHRELKTPMPGVLETGSTFLSVYSQIYVRNSENVVDLAATISLHNPNLKDRIYIEKAIFYNTKGDEIRSYLKKPIFIEPMETVQIIIDGIDNEGGTGANFVFDWKTAKNAPIFEAVMITSYGQQNVSFVTEGKRIER